MAYACRLVMLRARELPLEAGSLAAFEVAEPEGLVGDGFGLGGKGLQLNSWRGA